MSTLINVLGLSHVGHLGATGGTGAGDVPSNEFRRSFNLGSVRISELQPKRDPFFTLAVKFRNEPTDDPEFKRLEKRDVWHRRYAFITAGGVGASDTAGTAISAISTANRMTVAQWALFINNTKFSVLDFTTDYNTEKGTITPYRVDQAGTKTSNAFFGTANGVPNFFFKGQQIRIPLSFIDNSNADKVALTGFATAVVELVTVEATSTKLAIRVISAPAWSLDTSDSVAFGVGVVGIAMTASTKDAFALSTEPGRALNTWPTATTFKKEDRVVIIGSVFAEGSGLPGTTYNDKYSDDYGYTQIFKNDLSMTNTAKATVLKLRPQEMAYRWQKTMLQHKKDITMAGLWSVKTKRDGTDTMLVRTTEGLIDYIMNNGFVFRLQATDGYDTFLDQLSEFYHPEIGQEGSVLFHVSTQIFNWFNRLGSSGFFQNTFKGTVGANPSVFNQDISIMGKKTVAGLDITEISTPHGMIRMTRDINLDGTNIRMVAVNYSNVFYRPLKGNGLNRDTSVYMGVQSLEHTGVDYTTDLVQTEAGFDFRLGETFAMWV